jgi:hypothetical protein
MASDGGIYLFLLYPDGSFEQEISIVILGLG